MNHKLSLIKNDDNNIEKRIFPRFPFCFLTFKGDGNRAFEVKDISLTGMQLALKDGSHTYRQDDLISGVLNWKGVSLEITGSIMWARGVRVGIEFNKGEFFQKELKSFLSIENIMRGMKPIHQNTMDMELPSNLKYWIQTDGPVEIFVWRHNNGETSRFQIIMLDNFVEYEDGKGLQSGRVLTKRDLDTPLVQEDEFLFQIDEKVDTDKIKFAKEIIANLTTEHLPAEASEFLQIKLGII